MNGCVTLIYLKTLCKYRLAILFAQSKPEPIIRLFSTIFSKKVFTQFDQTNGTHGVLLFKR